MDDDETVGGEELEPTEVPDEVETDTSGEPNGGPEPPALIGGKFKTVDDAIEAYKQAESNMHTKTTALSKLAKQLRDMGCDVNEDSGELALPQNQQAAPGPAVDPTEDPNEKFVNHFLENPYSALAEFTQAVRGIEKKATANVKRELSKLKSQHLFGKVSDALEADLSEVADNMLANPQTAERIVKDTWEKVVGRYTIEQSQAAGSDPTSRMAVLRDLGLEEPTTASEPEAGGMVMTTAEKNMLRGLGISDSKEQQRLIKNVRQQEKEAKDNA
jgi:hypothetical protein